ncbi:MAG TPA: hypothetical protein VF753_03605 [Terriglobales bacterium]
MAIWTSEASFVGLIASEMNAAVERSLECWMAEIDRALSDTRLTTMGRLHAVEDILQQYKTLTGKASLDGIIRHDS